jgi:hypothetical protein
MATENCLEMGRYEYADLEVGRECWVNSVFCGNDSTNVNIKIAAECDMSCVGGTREESCGGSARMSLWTRGW